MIRDSVKNQVGLMVRSVKRESVRARKVYSYLRYRQLKVEKRAGPKWLYANALFDINDLLIYA